LFPSSATAQTYHHAPYFAKLRSLGALCVRSFALAFALAFPSLIPQGICPHPRHPIPSLYLTVKFIHKASLILPQFDSQFEENLYQLRREKLQQIADIVRAQNPATTDIAAKYPNSFAFTHTIPQLRALGDPLDTETLAAQHVEASIAGRIMAIRVQGKAGFAQLQQGGQRLQLYVRKDDVGEPTFALYKLLDLGDHIGVRGYLMRTRTGELTLHVSSITFLTKSMLALPDKYHGLEDVELRYRQRYVDLIMNSGTREPVPTLAQTAAIVDAAVPAITAAAPTISVPPSDTPQNSVILSEAQSAQPKDLPQSSPTSTAETISTTESEPTPINVRETFVKRAAILRSIRNFFDTRGYLEVETPMLHTIAGGAAARPFTTHHNALDIPLNLRIAPELYLKRLVVGGFDRVYEINRNFRNEGVSTQHNPEFTMLEFYQAYANYHDLIDLTQELITFVANEVNGTTLTTFNGTEIDLSKWTKLSMREAIIKFWPQARLGSTPSYDMFLSQSTFEYWIENAQQFALQQHKEKRNHSPSLTIVQDIHEEVAEFLGDILFDLANGAPLGKLIAELFEALAEEHLIQPTIIYDFPLAVSPLSKIKPDEPDWVERFEFYIGGFEVGNAFSELNDPDDQLRRFESQLEDRKRGDDEAMAEVDEDYVRALGIGLPPTAGEGIGIDRLTMILTGSRSIRDVILFPLMRPHKPTPEALDEPHGESAE